jgi:predicted metal-dependent phosphoesterase TrpH
MLKFQRNKLVSVYQDTYEEVRVHGLLEDDIWGLEIDLTVHIDDMTIATIQGKWNREETPECSRALPLMEVAKGFKIDNQTLGQQINKVVSRQACPHFANLLLECCQAAREAVGVIQFMAAQKEQKDLRFADYLKGHAGEKKENQTIAVNKQKQEVTIATHEQQSKPGKKASENFFVDLHMHSCPASQCSTANIEDLIVEAKKIGLDAICLTDHNHVWPPDDIENLRQKYGFPVLRGNEITTDQGDMLVFGMYQDVKGIISLIELRKMVDAAGGFIIAAHPFRGFLVFNTSQIGMTVEKATKRPVYQQVNAMEVLNGKVTRPENDFAAQVAAGLNLPTTGGSDAHAIGDVGRYVTSFQQNIVNEQDLVTALKQGDYKPYMYRKFRQQGEHNVQ